MLNPPSLVGKPDRFGILEQKASKVFSIKPRYDTTLTSVIIGNGVTKLGDLVFNNCQNLATITIPRSIETIGRFAFNGCSLLKDFHCYAEKIPQVKKNTFKQSYYKNATLHVPASSITLYRTTKIWCNFGTIVAIEK